MAYLNNIIIYLNTVEKYKKYVKWILERLYKKNILIIIKKCKFYTKKTNFIGFIIELRQININLKKIKAIKDWKDLKNVTDFKLFLKFCNYYRRFIAKQSDKTELFTKMMKKNKLWIWNDKKSKLFQKIKKKFTKKPILKIYQLILPIKIKTNTLNFALRACLLQKHNGI